MSVGLIEMIDIECVFDITNHVSIFFHACPSAILNLAKEVRITN